ncbi:MAG: hypothetical protein HOP19_04930 [Acidobacteria bacterium]|nr:hypothetical protein [Acidobacteriota bacterium]
MAWFSEEQVSLRQRYLMLEGHLSERARAVCANGLPADIGNNTVVMFVSFAYADLSIGHQFEVVYPKSRPAEGFECKSRIVSVTQQFSIPLEAVPHGWKTICVIEFPDGIPALISNHEVVNAWYENQSWVCLSSKATWQAIKIGGQ